MARPFLMPSVPAPAGSPRTAGNRMAHCCEAPSAAASAAVRGLAARGAGGGQHRRAERGRDDDRHPRLQRVGRRAEEGRRRHLRGVHEAAGITVDVNTKDHNTFQEQINSYLQGTPDDVFTLVRRLPHAVLRGQGAGHPDRRRVEEDRRATSPTR